MMVLRCDKDNDDEAKEEYQTASDQLRKEHDDLENRLQTEANKQQTRLVAESINTAREKLLSSKSSGSGTFQTEQ